MCTTCILLSDMISLPVQVKWLATGHMEFKTIFRAWVGGQIIIVTHICDVQHISVNVDTTKAVPHQNVARCRDGESVSRVCLEGSECWLGCYTVKEYTSLFLNFSTNCFFHAATSGIRHSPPSLYLYLFLWETFLLSLYTQGYEHEAIQKQFRKQYRGAPKRRWF